MLYLPEKKCCGHLKVVEGKESEKPGEGKINRAEHSLRIYYVQARPEQLTKKMAARPPHGSVRERLLLSFGRLRDRDTGISVDHGHADRT